MNIKTVVLFISLALVGILIFGCTQAEHPTKINQSENISPKQIVHQDEEEKITPRLNLSIGESAEAEDKIVTVKKVEKLASYIDKDFNIEKLPDKGNVFLIAGVEIKYVGDDKAWADPGDFSIVDSEGNKYEPIYGSLGADIEDALELTELFQNEKAKGRVVFEIPENASGLVLQYNFGSVFQKPSLGRWIIPDTLEIIELKRNASIQITNVDTEWNELEYVEDYGYINSIELTITNTGENIIDPEIDVLITKNGKLVANETSVGFIAELSPGETINDDISLLQEIEEKGDYNITVVLRHDQDPTPIATTSKLVTIE